MWLSSITPPTSPSCLYTSLLYDSPSPGRSSLCSFCLFRTTLRSSQSVGNVNTFLLHSGTLNLWSKVTSFRDFPRNATRNGIPRRLLRSIYRSPISSTTPLDQTNRLDVWRNVLENGFWITRMKHHSRLLKSPNHNRRRGHSTSRTRSREGS